MAVSSLLALSLLAGIAQAEAPASNAQCPQAGCLASDPGDLDVPNVTAAKAAKGAVSILSFTAGVLSAVFLIIGGLRYTSSGGNSQRVEGAKQTILYAVIGLILSLLSFSIVGFVIKTGP